MKLTKVFFTLATILALFTLSTLSLSAQTQGKASYYSNRLHGRRVSDGTRYHKDSLTCAHRTLPFGTLLKVTNKANGKEVVVKVNDRGPFLKGRVVDLSMAAARELGMVSSGVASVTVEQVGFQGTQEGTAGVEETLGIPEIKYLDPATGMYYTMEEWKQRGEKIRQQHMAELRKKQQPRYHILGTKLTAKNLTSKSSNKQAN